jgi:DNA (cytosine-5)-methyltransferase 1
MQKKKRVISLFSGAMGLDLGLEAAGLTIAVAVEKNATAVKTIKLNRPELPVLDEPIGQITAEDILLAGTLRKREAFALTGGPCCQSFSTAGKRRSISDEDRGTLFRDFKRIVAATQPRFFVMENVRGMLSAAVRHRPLNKRGPGYAPLAKDEEFGSALKLICDELAELNYYVIFGLVNCADYGVPQKRLRVIFIGSRDGEDILIPSRTHSPTNPKRRWITLEEAIGHLRQGRPQFIPFAHRRLKLLQLLKAGQNWRDLPAHLQEGALGAAYQSWGGRSGFCRRLSWQEPAPTLTTDPIGRATTLCHPDRPRPLSVREYAELQQFPATWRFAGSISQRYVQIGNAVPIGLGRAVGRMLVRVARETDEFGLPTEAKKRKGQVMCFDPDLARRLQQRGKTRLNPPKMRRYQNPATARQWLEKVAA